MSDDKFYSFDEQPIEHVIVCTTRGVERASLPVIYIPRLDNGQFNFRPGVYTLAFWQRMTANGQPVQMQEFYKLPEYQNEPSRLYALQFPEQKKTSKKGNHTRCCF
jgi:hypothetical protein